MNEVVLDTNILVRLLAGDVPDQTSKAKKLVSRIEEGELKASISVLVIHEILWIGEHFYELDREIVVGELLKVLKLTQVKVEEIAKGALERMFDAYVNSPKRVDFTDVYLAGVAGKRAVASFDKHLTKLGARMLSF